MLVRNGRLGVKTVRVRVHVDVVQAANCTLPYVTDPQRDWQWQSKRERPFT